MLWYLSLSKLHFGVLRYNQSAQDNYSCKSYRTKKVFKSLSLNISVRNKDLALLFHFINMMHYTLLMFVVVAYLKRIKKERKQTFRADCPVRHHAAFARKVQSSQSAVCIRLWAGMSFTHTHTHTLMNLNTHRMCASPCTEHSHNTAQLRGPLSLLPAVFFFFSFCDPYSTVLVKALVWLCVTRIQSQCITSYSR